MEGDKLNYINETVASIRSIILEVAGLNIVHKLTTYDSIKFYTSKPLSSISIEDIQNSMNNNWMLFSLVNFNDKYNYLFVNNVLEEDVKIYLRDKYLKELI